MPLRIPSWQLILLGIIMGAVVLMAGCADAPPTPAPLQPGATAAAQQPVQVPARALPLGSEPAPTRILTLTVSATRLARPSPTSSASPTSSPSPTPTSALTPTPTLTSSPTPQPSALLQAAQRHQTNGDYDQAIAAYLALLGDDPTADQAREAHYGLAESYQSNGEYPAAAATWEEFLASYPDDARRPQATLMAARAYQAVNECSKAIPHYQAYLTEQDVLADMVYEWIGDCHAGDERLTEAIAAYGQALAATTDRAVQVNLREKIAGAHLASQSYEAAVAQYDAILNVAKLGYYRAKIEYLAGQALFAAGQTEAAYARYHRAVDRYADTEYAYLSLVELVDAGVEVDEYQRGLVDYHAGAAYPDAYGAAIRAFDRYLAGEVVDKADAALYYKALAQRALEQPDAALETLTALIAGYRKSNWLVRAWLEKGATYAWLGDNDAAIQAYQDLAAFFPADKLAPEALWRAAKLREGERAFGEAATLYEALQASFPGFQDADQALWRAGLAHYQAGSRDKALAGWRSLLDKYPKSAYRAKALYWLGKLGAKGDPAGQGDYWDQLVAADPHAYYALRVEQIRAGESLTATRLVTTAVESPVWDATEAEREILTWLRGWTQVPTDTTRLHLPVTVTQRLDFQRGEALLAAGLRREALQAFDGTRAAAWDDPLLLAPLSLFFHERGLHGLAARCASRLAVLRPKGTIHTAPEAVQRLAYPLAYADLLSVEAQERNLDPLFLAALVRQESLFEPVAESYAGARGLGQVMPATGTGIANSLGVKDFVLEDLDRPSVSIRFGAYYLAVQMNRFDDELLIALAAYNGGPGNTLRWLEAAGDNLDLLVEVITATQSRVYLQRVYEQYLIYERLYRPAGSGER